MIDPVAFHIGPLDIKWYGIAYVVGILLGMYYARLLSRKYALKLTPKLLDDFLIYLVIGMILGGRLGYVLIYDSARYFNNPLEILEIRNGGMSFHGAIVGIALLSYVFCKMNKMPFLLLTDIISIVAPIGLFLGRMANFVNGELYGRTTDVLWAVNSRHPSQIYEALLEGIALFIIMYFSSRRLRQSGYNTGVFLIFYHVFRVFCEFFREPDIQLGFVVATFSMGQLLSVPFIILGVYLCLLNRKSES